VAEAGAGVEEVARSQVVDFQLSTVHEKFSLVCLIPVMLGGQTKQFLANSACTRAKRS
jgi:hypothetical protein